MKGRIHANTKIISMTVNHSFIFPILTLYIPSAIRYVCDFYRFSAGSCISFDQGSLISFSFALFELTGHFIYSSIANLSFLK